jgi:hypothetical protein
MTHPTRLAAALLAVLSAGLLARSADLTTLDGNKTTGTLVAVEPDAVSFQDKATETVVKYPVKALAAIDFGNKVATPPKDAKYDEVELTDGSVLRVTKFGIKVKAADLALLPGPADVPPPKFDVPMTALFGVMRNAEDPTVRAGWRKLLAGRGKRDLFVILQGDGYNSLPGTVIEGSAEGDRVTFEGEDGTRRTLPLTRATGGLVFNQPPRDVIPPTVCKVYDVFGNVLFANAVQLAGAGMKVTTVSGAVVEYPELRAVSKLDFSQGNVSYLSDLEAIAAYPPPEKDGALGEAYPLALQYAKDRGLDGSEIVIGGRKFTRGVSVPADVVLTYRLDGQFREFKAVAGVLDSIRPDDAALRLRVEVDGRPVLTETVSKKNPPREINLNVKDAKELKIAVERESLFAGNQVNLGDARLQK